MPISMRRCDFVTHWLNADRWAREDPDCQSGLVLQGLTQAAGLPGFRDALHAGASSRGADGVERRGLRRLLPL